MSGQASQLDVTVVILTMRFCLTSLEMADGSFPIFVVMWQNGLPCSRPIWISVRSESVRCLCFVIKSYTCPRLSSTLFSRIRLVSSFGSDLELTLRLNAFFLGLEKSNDLLFLIFYDRTLYIRCTLNLMNNKLIFRSVE